MARPPNYVEDVPKGPHATREGHATREDHEKKTKAEKPESTRLFVKKLTCIGLSMPSPSFVDPRAAENMR